MIEIHIAGAYSESPGRGGWAVLIRSPEGVREIVGSATDTTNHRMELQAAIEGLRVVPTDSPATVCSDSEYLIKGMTEWLPGWKQRGWRTADKKPVKNRELWEALDNLAGARVTWQLVQGHAEDTDNKRVKALALCEARREGPGNAIGGVTLTATVGDDTMNPAVAFPCYLSLVNGVAARHSTWESCEARTRGCPGEKKRRCISLKVAEETLRSWGLPTDLPKEWPEPGVPLAPSPPALRQPESRLFARGILDRVRSHLEGAGFRPKHDNGPSVAFHLARDDAHVKAYTTGRLQTQGSWTDRDLTAWEKLTSEEAGWLRASVDAISAYPTPSRFAWSAEVCQYLFNHLSALSIIGWSAEPIGRFLLVRDVQTGLTVGTLSRSAWQRLLPEAGDAIARSVQDHRWDEQGRMCVAIHQDQCMNLTAVGVRFSRTAYAAAGLWDWEAAGDANSDEQRRIAGLVHPFLVWNCHRWPEADWRQKAAEIGNQIDVLIEWVRQTLASEDIPTTTSWVRPVEVIGKWGGSEECAARLLEHRSSGRLRFRTPLLAEENDGLAMARFLAKAPPGAQT